MAVFRVERNTGYTVMSNHHLRNKELSLLFFFVRPCFDAPFHSEGLGHFPTSNFADAAAEQGRQNTEVGTRFLCLLFIFSLSSTIKTGFCQRHPQEKKNAIETQRFHSVLSAYSVLVIVFFDFRYFLCRSRNDTQTVIAHAVKQSIKLPPLRGLLGVIIRKEKLVYRNMITSNKVIENLQARLLSLVLDIRKIARGYIERVAYRFAALSVFFSRGFYGCPERLKVI